jgi:hypothetical protein
MKKFVRENSLSLFFGVILLGALVGQSFAGQRVYNADAAEHGEKTISWAHYLVTPEFGGDLLENWQSEFLQFSLYIMATVWFLQRGSNESKALDDAGLETDEQQRVGEHAQRNSPAWAKVGGMRRWVYSHSLFLVMTTIFLLSWLGQSLNGWRAFNNAQDEHKSAHIGYVDYLVDADFWNRTLQNWQSEFLAVGAMAVFTIYLRQRGSPESKPVGAPHGETASSG